MERITITEPSFKHYCVILPLYAFIRIWQFTVRIKVSGQSLKILTNPDKLIGLAWHSRIFFLPMCKYLYRPKLPMSGLVSASRDGAYLCAFFNLMKIGTVRGSSKRRGAGAIIDLIERLKSSDIFITPDGPRGPKNIAKSGFLRVAKESGVNILLLRINARHSFSLPTWDNFILPLPFTVADMDVCKFESAASLKNAARELGLSETELVSKYLNGEISLPPVVS